MSSGPPVPPPRPGAADPSALDHIVDDLAPRREAGQWAEAQLLAGRTFEELSGELVAAGWSEDDAAEVVEDARKQTRHERGVTTRNDIVAVLNRRYRASTRGWFIAFPVLAAAWRLGWSLLNMMFLGRRRR